MVLSPSGGTPDGPAHSLDAAANAYCDALVQRRRAAGLPATSIVWGPHTGAAPTAPPDHSGSPDHDGVRPLATRFALAALPQALAHGGTLLTVADIDWDRFAPRHAAEFCATLLRSLPAAAPYLASPGDGANADRPVPLLDQLDGAADAEERLALLSRFVLQTTAEVLGHSSAENPLDPEDGFLDLGFTSLSAVQLRNLLSTETGVDLPPPPSSTTSPPPPPSSTTCTPS